MVLPISGFMPVPLAMMIPFMFMQSIMMGYGFGTGFQYSKRKISAMSNEEFNKTTIKDETVKMFEAYTKIIPDLQQSIRDSKDLQVTVVEEMVKIPAHLLNALLGTSDKGSSTPDSPAPVPTIGENAPESAADVFKITAKELKNWQISIDYKETPVYGATPNSSLIKSTAVKWWFASGNDRTFGSFVDFVNVTRQNFGGKWYFKGTVKYK